MKKSVRDYCVTLRFESRSKTIKISVGVSKSMRKIMMESLFMIILMVSRIWRFSLINNSIQLVVLELHYIIYYIHTRVNVLAMSQNVYSSGMGQDIELTNSQMCLPILVYAYVKLLFFTLNLDEFTKFDK